MIKGWADPDLALGGLVDELRGKCIRVYKEDSTRVKEDAGKERGIAEGGYGRKQIQELVQNAADALHRSPGRIQVSLTGEALYVANEGVPFDASGVRALLYTHLSNKTGTEIGRFGLGFKSISGISDSPQIFSRSVSFEFSRQQAADQLSAELNENYSPSDIPALRLAWTLSPSNEFRSDPVLAELAAWATTVVKVPLKAGTAEQLSEEIDQFDESFNLFAPHVRMLDLFDGVAGRERHFTAAKKGNFVRLTTEDSDRNWLVVSTDHKPSLEALESAGHAARRESITVSWALPLTGGVGLGQLSAFFPVKSDITLSGRVNAPWKLSDDRINVIECEFNLEILVDVLPQLVVAARKDLIADRAFGRYIDVLPARGKEARSWADKVLNEPVYQALRDSRCLPDLDGQLRAPSSLQRIPDVVVDLATRWLEVTGNRGGWVHPECTTSTERRSKVDRLLQEGESAKSPGRVLHWLQSVVADPQPKKSAAAIELAAKLVGKGDNTEMDVRDARIVLLENNTLAQPVRGRCFLRTSAGQSGTSFVAEAVAGQPSAVDALKHLGITPFEDGGEMLQLLTQLRATGKVDWDELWIAMRGSGVQLVHEAFEEVLGGHAAKVVQVRNGDGRWVVPRGLYFPGEGLKQLREDGAYLVDAAYHAADHEILYLLGIRARPLRSAVHSSETWVARYRREVRETIGDELGLGVQARQAIAIETVDSVLGPLECLPDLSLTNRVALSVAVISDIDVPRVRVSHPNVSKTARYIAPELWQVREHGLLPTTLGPVPVAETFVSEVDGVPAGLLPCLTQLVLSSETERVLKLKRQVSELDSADFSWLVHTHVERDDLLRVGQSYAWWCWTHKEVDPPDRLWVRRDGQWSEEDRSAVAVVHGMEAYTELDSFGIPCVVVDSIDDVHTLSELWDCLQGRDLPVTYSYETSAESELVSDVFPILDTLPVGDELEDLFLQKCLSISKVAAVPGQPEVRVECAAAREANRILVTGSSDGQVLKQVLGCLLLDDSDRQVELLLNDMERRRNSKRVREIRSASSDAERLLMLAGEERLKTLIPRDALTYLVRDGSVEPHGLDLAKLCVTMLGVRALERACKVDPQGLPDSAPSAWAGSFNTRKWVKSLGFGEEWAGEKARRRNKPTEYVDGPTQLDGLHDYQQVVSERLLKLLSGQGYRRGIISLPTGAGKTRVAVQTIIEAIRDDRIDENAGEATLSGPILWLADGEELCEQAIDAWSYLWRAVGRQDTQLILSRFWSSYEMEEEVAGVQVVVATWQKILARAVDNDSFAWLAEAPIVIIDEAHGAYTPSYTKILEWLGRGTRERDKPLIGLTATPFRGRRDSAETERLLRRFDENRLDEGVFGDELPQLRLQRDRVLAHAHLEILGGISIDLTDSELEEFKSKGWLSKNAESRLGRHEDRTRTIVDSVMSKPAEWQIVVFAASVESAQTLATLLTIQGRPASSIDQDTSPEDRRVAIERFKSGELKVLTNYAVLSQGFDAPKTDAVYITRPTTSEVRYQQMVGRGLRGPKNGGTEEVLIVNMLDNIMEFGDSIVFQPMKDIIEPDSTEEDIANVG
ncbi:DEAD/DEAH box helicase [Candidatus Mycobacterium wuenschmannii]|uniref:DEAD/DEAH box helicase n=1 Tax=Candidatus Mycobacterium wuenschmannii TaxID=3027808 RepID=A0ABY8W3M2_9MYCO|nr:DEAD/DEAH box helicase [Candidatus Mycobacterium wuenschmannii]WIM90454.1 DEAD/DEAH box helicase [Candidatus Mycobacterium wuenschmannii]